MRLSSYSDRQNFPHICPFRSTFAPPTKRKASVSFAESFSEDTKPRLSNLSISTPPTDVDYSHPMLAGVYYNAPRQFKVLRIRHLASTTDAQTIRTFLGTLMPSTVIGKISFMRYTSFSGYSVVVRLDPSFALDVLIQSHKNREIQLDDSSITLCVGLPAICVKGIFPNGTSMNDMLQKLEIRPMFYNAAFGIMTFTTYQEGVEAMKLLWDAVDEMGVQNFDCRWSYDDTPRYAQSNSRAHRAINMLTLLCTRRTVFPKLVQLSISALLLPRVFLRPLLPMRPVVPPSHPAHPRLSLSPSLYLPTIRTTPSTPSHSLSSLFHLLRRTKLSSSFFVRLLELIRRRRWVV